jgi:hypothetical protein
VAMVRVVVSASEGADEAANSESAPKRAPENGFTVSSHYFSH